MAKAGLTMTRQRLRLWRLFVTSCC